MSTIGELFHVGVAILSTTIDKVTNTVLAQLGSVTEEYVYSDNAELYGSLGLAARPSKPTKGQNAAECVALKGDRDIILACRDKRGQAIYGNLKEGETCLYGPGEFGTSKGRVLIKQDGSVTLMTTDTNTTDGNTVGLRISPTGGLFFTSQWGTMKLDETGFHVITAAGPRIDMGGANIPGLSSVPLGSSIAGYCTITAPIVKCAGSSVFLGMGPVYGTALNAQPNLLTPASLPPLPISPLAETSSLFSSQTVWVSP